MGASAAMVGAAVIGAGGAIGSSIISSQGQKDAAEAYASSASNANSVEWDIYQQNRQDVMPWRDAGVKALSVVEQDLLNPTGRWHDFSFDTNDLYKDPGYVWRKSQGLDAIKAQGAAAGNYGSGRMATAMADYASGLASQEYANAYGRQYGEWLDAFNMVSGLAGTGQTAASALGTLGMSASTNIGNTLLSQGGALASGISGSANAWGSGMTGVSNALTSGIGTYLRSIEQQKLIDAITGNNTTNTTSSGSSGLLSGFSSLPSLFGSGGGGVDASSMSGIANVLQGFGAGGGGWG